MVNKGEKFSVAVLLIVMSGLMVACSTSNSSDEVEKTDSELTKSEVNEDIQSEEEVWVETDKNTGEKTEVTVIRHLENGKVVMETETRTPVEEESDSGEDSSEEESNSEEDSEEISEEGSEESDSGENSE